MIVSTRLSYEPKIHAVILIDCWDVADQNIPIKHSIQNFYHDLLLDLKKHKIQIVVNAMTQRHMLRADPVIKSHLFDHKCVVDLESLQDFRLFANEQLNNNITNWYVAGQSWNMCVHENDIGLNNLSKFTNNGSIGFYSTIKSFLKFNGQTVDHEDFEKDALGWEHLNWFGYRLLGK